ncbi:MAG: metallophosphoesterase [Herbaspirillum sp.]
MRLAVLSDLHLTVADMPPPKLDCDLVILAGDIARPEQGIAWAKQFPQPVIYIPGNHEFYGSNLKATYAALKQHAAGTHIHVLDQDQFQLNGVRFLGCTLWSDFRLADDPAERTKAVELSLKFNRDFTRIKQDEDSDALFSPARSAELFDASVQWLESQFAQPFTGTTVVVTHHAPALGSINPRFAGSPLNASFVSNLEAQIQRWKPALWIHGHLHDSYDYSVGDTRVLCNPRGYARDGVAENAVFNPQLVIDL